MSSSQKYSQKKDPVIKPLGGGSSVNTVSRITNAKTASSSNKKTEDMRPTLSVGVGARYKGVDGLVFGVFLFVLVLAFIGQTTSWYEFDLTVLWQFWPLWLVFIMLAVYLHRHASVITNTVVSLLFVGTVGVVWVSGITPSDLNMTIASTVNGSGDIVSQTRNLSGFDKVAFNGNGTVILRQGDKEKVVIQAEDTVLKNIITAVTDDGVLTIDFRKESLWERVVPKQDPLFYITVDDIKKIDITGSGSVQSGTIKTPSLELQLRGSGDMDINMNVTSLVTSAFGSGNITLSGVAHTQEVLVNGSAEYDGQNLVGRKGSVNVIGTGTAMVNLITSLDVLIDGPGRVTYLGSPSITQNIEGSGALIKHSSDITLNN